MIISNNNMWTVLGGGGWQALRVTLGTGGAVWLPSIRAQWGGNIDWRGDKRPPATPRLRLIAHYCHPHTSTRPSPTSLLLITHKKIHYPHTYYPSCLHSPLSTLFTGSLIDHYPLPCSGSSWVMGPLAAAKRTQNVWQCLPMIFLLLVVMFFFYPRTGGVWAMCMFFVCV